MTGAPDLVDVNYKIEEGPSAQLGGGIGYSETYKFQLNVSYADANFLGTGQRVAIELNGGAFSKVYSVADEPVHHGREPAAHDLADLSRRDPVLVVPRTSHRRA